MKYADELTFNFNRPLAAEPIILEVISYCEKKNDKSCLIDAYFTYGKFLQSDEVTIRYQKGNFIPSYFYNKNITYDNRKQKAKEYFENALFLAMKNKIFDRVSGIYYFIGSMQFLDLKDKESSCHSLDESLKYNLIYTKSHPSSHITMPKGYTNYRDVIAEGKKEMGCSTN